MKQNPPPDVMNKLITSRRSRRSRREERVKIESWKAEKDDSGCYPSVGQLRRTCNKSKRSSDELAAVNRVVETGRGAAMESMQQNERSKISAIISKKVMRKHSKGPRLSCSGSSAIFSRGGRHQYIQIDVFPCLFSHVLVFFVWMFLD